MAVDAAPSSVIKPIERLYAERITRTGVATVFTGCFMQCIGRYCGQAVFEEQIKERVVSASFIG